MSRRRHASRRLSHRAKLVFSTSATVAGRSHGLERIRCIKRHFGVAPRDGCEPDDLVVHQREASRGPTEVDSLIMAVPVQDRALWATAFYAGLRRGELQACGVRKLGPLSRKRGFAGETELTHPTRTCDLLQAASAVVVSGGVEHLQFRLQAGEPLGELDPAHLRHQDVRHQQLDRIGMLLRKLESRGTVSGEQNRVPDPPLPGVLEVSDCGSASPRSVLS
jgi:hypothetical protein